MHREYRAGAIHSDERHHRWLFDDNPDNGAEGPQYWIYQKEGTIHGQQAGIPFALFVNGAARRASWAINLKVTPAYQMRGIGGVLSEIYLRDNEVTAAVNVTEAARKAFLRAGWEFLGRIPKYVRPLRTAGIRAGLPGALRGLAPLFYPLLLVVDGWWWSYLRLHGFRMEPVAAFDPRIDQVWNEASDAYPVVGRRDYTRLRWRFDAAPDPRRYHRFYLFQGGRLSGYAVLRYSIRNGRRVAVVVDFLCPPRLLRALFALCLQQARHAGMDDLQTVMCHCPGRTGTLLSLGFLQRDSSEHEFLVHYGKEEDVTRHLLGNRHNWFVTMADCDLEWMFLREHETEPEQQV
ncbi:MAG TPA: hypothetical protein ENJ43_00190 [Gammaproteobacteria bacterium]|nr:hypothetical protein [Gammaproteobacteria bacterium]